MSRAKGARTEKRGTKTNDGPTVRMMRALEQAYEHFNASLFESELPPLFLNLSRSKKGVMGFFAPGAWRGAGESICELSLTPSCTSLNVKDVFATLVHEMAHHWEHIQGIKPRSPGYHGKEWWSFMEKIGLPPAPQGKNGKSRLKVFQTIKHDGAFAAAFNELPEDVRLPFVSVERVAGAEGKQTGSKQGKRARYECSGECGTTMRGPSGRALICGDCEAPYIETGF